MDILDIRTRSSRLGRAARTTPLKSHGPRDEHIPPGRIPLKDSRAQTPGLGAPPAQRGHKTVYLSREHSELSTKQQSIRQRQKPLLLWAPPQRAADVVRQALTLLKCGLSRTTDATIRRRWVFLARTPDSIFECGMHPARSAEPRYSILHCRICSRPATPVALPRRTFSRRRPWRPDCWHRSCHALSWSATPPQLGICVAQSGCATPGNPGSDVAAADARAPRP